MCALATGFVLIDDEPDDIFFLRRRLFQAGIRDPVATFESGADAVCFLDAAADKSTVPTWVFIDVTMPATPGLQLLREMRAVPKFSSVRIAMLSNVVRPHEVEDATANGADAFLQKFPTPNLLRDMIANPTGRFGLHGGTFIGDVTTTLV